MDSINFVLEYGMGQVSVRQENKDDIRAIDVVHLSAFEGDAEAGLIDDLRASSSFIPELSLVAEFNGRIVGHILLSKVKLLSDAGGQDILALAPMAVVPSQSHRGIGSELVQRAIEEAKALGQKAIVVAGRPDFYKRFGFEPASKWGLTSNLSIATDLITAIELEEGSLGGGGNVIYPSMFEKVY
jgi:putative acetyltransferase